MRLAALLPIVLLLALASCGGDEAETTTTTAPLDHAAEVAKVRTAFERSEDCKPPQGASRWGCSVGSYRCQGVVTGRGWSVSCAKRGRSLAFRIQPG